MLTVSGLKRLHISVSFDLQDGECVALQGPSGVPSLWQMLADCSGSATVMPAAQEAAIGASICITSASTTMGRNRSSRRRIGPPYAGGYPREGRWSRWAAIPGCRKQGGAYDLLDVCCAPATVHPRRRPSRALELAHLPGPKFGCVVPSSPN
jgi:hypothetical protein